MTVAAWVEYVDPKHEAGKLIQRIMRGTSRATEAWTDGRHAEDDRYHARRNQLERFRVFLELMTRFEFEFRRRGNFFEGFEFLVCSKFNHTHHLAVNVHVLWPVCTHTIPLRMLLCP